MGKEERTVRMFVAVVYNLRTVIAFCNETAGGRTVFAVVSLLAPQIGSCYDSTRL